MLKTTSSNNVTTNSCKLIWYCCPKIGRGFNYSRVYIRIYPYVYYGKCVFACVSLFVFSVSQVGCDLSFMRIVLYQIKKKRYMFFVFFWLFFFLFCFVSNFDQIFSHSFIQFVSPICSIKGVFFGSKDYSKELKLSSVHVFWARLASFGTLGLISDPQISSNSKLKSIIPKDCKIKFTLWWGTERLFTVTTQSQSPALVTFNMFYKRVIVEKQGFHKKKQKNWKLSIVQVFWARPASFGQLGLISNPQIFSSPKMKSIIHNDEKIKSTLWWRAGRLITVTNHPSIERVGRKTLKNWPENYFDSVQIGDSNQPIHKEGVKSKCHVSISKYGHHPHPISCTPLTTHCWWVLH